MQPNEFILPVIVLAAMFCGWRLIRFVRSRSTAAKVAGYVSGVGIIALSGSALLLYGWAMVKKYRSVPSVSPNGKYIAQVTELDFGPGPFDTQVEVRSRWQVSPDIVLAGHGDPWDIDLRWRGNSELVIRYPSGYASDAYPAYPAPCERQFKAVKITCEPVIGYMLRPNATATRGQQLRAAIDQRYKDLSGAHAISGNVVQITDVLLRYISEGASYFEALHTLMAAGFLVNRQSPDQDVGRYSIRSICRADVNVVLYWHGPTDSGVVQKVDGWIDVTCP
jgi:hypothetical protein